MESDIDEEENDFRHTKTSRKKQKPVKQKKHTASRPKKVRKEDVCLKLTMRKVAKKSDSNCSTPADNITGSSSVECIGEGSIAESETSHCPSCGKLFDITQLPDHVKVCLHENFEACKLARYEGMGYVQRSAFKSAGEKLSGGRTTLEWSFCTICGTNLCSLTCNQRNLHINRCLDSKSSQRTTTLSNPANSMARPASQKKLKTAKTVTVFDTQVGKTQGTGSVIKKEECPVSETAYVAPPQRNEFAKGKSNLKKDLKTSKRVKKAKATAQNDELRCSLCLIKVCSSRAGLARHMHHCQKKHKITTACAMALNKPHNDGNDFADDEILSQIRRVDDRDGVKVEEKVVLPPKVKRKRHPREEKNKMDVQEEKMLQLALRVSAGDDLERKKSKKRNTIRFPVMIELSPNTKRQQLEGRFRSITNPPGEETVDEIPSTPALPPSNLTNTKIHVSHRTRILETGGRDDDQPGPSGIMSNQNFLPRETLKTNTDDDPQTSTSNGISSFGNLVNDELQSPEVSSSSIKPASLSNHNDAHILNAPDVASDDQTTVQSRSRQSVKKSSTRQRSNWSLACNEASTSNSDYRVRNLLSQFDKSGRQENSSHNEDIPDVRTTPNMPQSSTNMVANVEESVGDVDHIDSTLAIMKELDETFDEENSGSQLDEDFFDEQISSSQQSESQMLHKLIDNQEFSDAKIYVGDKGEVIYLHKNILYCNCSELLKEINAASAKEETLCLENYTKREVMPMICFIYSGKIEPLLNAAKHDLNLFAKTEELLKKYAVLITDADQLLLDAAIEQHQVKSQGWDKRIDCSPVSSQRDENFVKAHDISFSTETGGYNGKDDCVSENSEESFLDDLLPRNLTQQDPINVSSEDNYFQNMSDASTSDYDMFACYIKPRDTEVPEQKLGVGVSVENNDSDPADPVANEFFRDPNHSMFLEDNSTSNVSFLYQKENGFSMSDPATSSPYSHSKNDLVPRAKKRKKDFTNVPVRKSQRVSLGRMGGGSGNGWHRRNCFCCSSSDHCHEDTPKKADITEKLSKFPTSKSLRKSLLSKQLRHSIPTLDSSKIEQTVSQSHHEANILKRRTSSQTDLTFTPSPITAPKKRKNQPKSDNQSSESKNAKRSVANSKTAAKKNLKSKHKLTSHSPTIYIGERLPRFKQREHIRSRPEVANMGKSTRGLSRSLNRKTPSNKNAVKKKSSVPAVLDSKKHVADLEQPAEHGKDKTAATAVPLQSTEVVASEALFKDLEVNPVAENMTAKDEPTRSIGDDVDIKPNSQHDAVSVESICAKQKPDSIVRKEYKFRKVCLAASYALPSPLKQTNADVRPSVKDVSSNDSDEQIEDDLLHESFCNKFFDVSSKSRRASHPDTTPSFPTTPVIESDESSRKSLLYVGPVPITPMPDFNSMPTPEVLHRASRIGLKKTLSKVKLKAKLEENYLYHHQIEPDESLANDEDLEVSKSNVQSEEAVKLKDVTSQNLYSFIQLPIEEILQLSSDVVDEIHNNGALLDALLSRKSETGKIKRGSRQDRARCWDMVTPGRPHYDPKLSAIVTLPEDVQNAITRPLTGCVAKNYFDYKKYQFECLRFLCDEIEHLYKKRYLP